MSADPVADAIAHLKDHGWAVVPDVFDADTMAAARRRLRGDLLAWTAGKVDLDDAATWDAWSAILPMHSMLVQHGSFGRLETFEALRFHPATRALFARVFGTSDLLVSFDAASVHLPRPGKGYFRKSWIHTDAGPGNAHLETEDAQCVQAQVVLNTARECDGTLLVYDGSHKLWQAYFDKFPPPSAAEGRKDWQRINEEDPAQVEFFSGCAKVRVAAPAGSVVLWYSRTFHCGAEPLKDRPALPDGSLPIRMVSYVCMMPRPALPATPSAARALLKLLTRRRQIYDKDGKGTDPRSSTHHPLRPRTFGRKPQTRGAPMPVMVAPVVVPYEDLEPQAQALVDGGPGFVEAVRAAAAAKV
jgi:hypothetical protein